MPGQAAEGNAFVTLFGVCGCILDVFKFNVVTYYIKYMFQILRTLLLAILTTH